MRTAITKLVNDCGESRLATTLVTKVRFSQSCMLELVAWRPSYRWILGAIFACLLNSFSTTLEAQPGKTEKGRWQEMFRVDEEHGEMLYEPGPLVVGRRNVVVYDQGAGHLVAFTLDGKKSWTFGRKGGGQVSLVMCLILQ